MDSIHLLFFPLLSPSQCISGLVEVLEEYVYIVSSLYLRYSQDRERLLGHVQGRAKKILLSLVAHVPSGLMGCALAA